MFLSLNQLNLCSSGLSCDIFIPNLLSNFNSNSSIFLTKILNRSKMYEQDSKVDILTWLKNKMPYTSNYIGPSNFPSAALIANACNIHGEHPYWLNLELVNYEVDHKNVFLNSLNKNQISQTESLSLMHEISNLMPNETKLYYLNPQNWLLNTKKFYNLTTIEKNNLINKKVLPPAKSGDDDKLFNLLSSEIQMAFHLSEINKERALSQKIIVNGVWFSGNGLLPETVQCDWHALWTNHAASIGLAHLANIKLYCLDDVPNLKDLIFKLHNQKKPCKFGVVMSDDNPGLEESLWQPLWTLLKQNKIDKLNIYSNIDKMFSIVPKDVWKFWRKYDAHFVSAQN